MTVDNANAVCEIVLSIRNSDGQVVMQHKLNIQ